MSTGRIVKGIRKAFPAPEWATFTEVRNATGSVEVARYLDTLSVNLWPSSRRGGEKQTGCEIKVSRADFLRELKDPSKSAAIRRYCSQFYLAVDGWKGILSSPGELDDYEATQGWGLLDVGERDPFVRLAAISTPEPLEEEFMLSLIRSAAKVANVEEGDESAATAERGPLVVVTRPHLSRSHMGLACGHTKPSAPFKRIPARAHCGACADEAPTDRDVIEAAIRDADPETLRALRSQIDAKMRARGFDAA